MQSKDGLASIMKSRFSQTQALLRLTPPNKVIDQAEARGGGTTVIRPHTWINEVTLSGGHSNRV